MGGKVKTRIAASTGNSAALEIYKQLLETTRSVTRKQDCQKHLFYSDFIDNNDLWANEIYNKQLQSGKDLGTRMKNAFNYVFGISAVQNSKVLIIGSDCPEISSSIIEEAFISLYDHDFVIGPSCDGGYYLLGMSEYYPAIFDSVIWSSDSVAQTTLDNIMKIGLSYHKLPALNDIDDIHDWQEYLTRRNRSI